MFIRSRLKRERFLFTAGCIALGFAMLSVTFLPFVVNNYMSKTFMSIAQYKSYAAVLYAITIFSFFFSPRYTKMQLKWIVITIAYYFAFQVLSKIIS